MEKPQNKLLSIGEAAAILEVSKVTLRKMALRDRVITCMVFGSRIKFRAEDIQTYISKATVHAKQPELK